MKRCTWPTNELSIRYHDEEWGVPLHDEQKLFEFLILEGAQAGLSWDTILRKRENYRKAFDGFDVNKVARYSDKKIEKLLLDEGIIRNRLKVASAVSNAKAFLEVQKEFGSFDKYIWSFVDGKPIVSKLKDSSQIPPRTEVSDVISKDLKKRGFNFVGSTIMYAFMQATGMVNDHLVSCFQVQAMLIDDFLSDYDFVETHGISIRADADAIYGAANEVDFSESWIIRWLFWLRGLSTEKVTLESLKRSRFEILGETPNKELLLGLIGRFWTPGGDLKKIDAAKFKAFDTAGYAKAVWNFSIRRDKDETRLTTETRIKCTDDTSRGRFRFYWTFVQPFNGLIRMEMLRAIKRRAEMSASV